MNDEDINGLALKILGNLVDNYEIGYYAGYHGNYEFRLSDQNEIKEVIIASIKNNATS